MFKFVVSKCQNVFASSWPLTPAKLSHIPCFLYIVYFWGAMECERLALLRVKAKFGWGKQYFLFVIILVCPPLTEIAALFYPCKCKSLSNSLFVHPHIDLQLKSLTYCSRVLCVIHFIFIAFYLPAAFYTFYTRKLLLLQRHTY